ncbi:multidrug-efflux transporter (plasmid) [Borreliella burgdorferi CA-11.2A]|nr:multidrug-efflux transporter [Borreliella burgdorferi 72a]ACN55962.1 multidrug-efflux transporter [Borreliella burgdorferi CA-11.2A]
MPHAVLAIILINKGLSLKDISYSTFHAYIAKKPYMGSSSYNEQIV